MDKGFGAWLRTQMDKRNLNSTGLAVYVGCSHTTVGNWLAGKKRPSPASIRRLARALDVPLTEIHVALGDIPPLTGLTEEQRRVVALLLEADDPRVYRAVEALLLSLRDS